VYLFLSMLSCCQILTLRTPLRALVYEVDLLEHELTSFQHVGTLSIERTGPVFMGELHGNRLDFTCVGQQGHPGSWNVVWDFQTNKYACWRIIDDDSGYDHTQKVSAQPIP